MLHFVHPESFCPLGISCRDVAAQGAELNLQLPWAPLAFVPLLCHLTVAICCCHCHCHPTWGPCPPGSPSQPQHGSSGASVRVGSVCWECASALGVSFGSRADSRAFGLLSFSLIAKVPGRNNNSEVCPSGAFRAHLTARALCWSLLCLGTAGNECPLPHSAQRIPKALTGIFILYFPV